MKPVGCTRAVAAAMIAGLVTLPAMAIEKRESSPCRAEAAVESYAWDFSGEIRTSLQLIESDSHLTKQKAAKLQTLARQPQIYSKATQAQELTEIRASVNRIASRLCRLQEVKAVAEPWQRENIDLVVETVQALAEDTKYAIDSLNSQRSQVGLTLPAYREAIAGLYIGADDLSHASDEGWSDIHMESAD
jgi:hypothetical protein